MKKHLLSYPRSGNHWLRFIVEWFSNRPTKGAGGGAQIGDFGLMDNTNGDYILYKNHYPTNMEPNEELLFILRNPKEAIIRHTLDFHTKPKFPDPKTMNWYMSLINFYDNHKGKKLIIYYEDLIENPKETIKDILIFLQIYDEKKLLSFIDNYDKLSNESINIFLTTDERHYSSTKGLKTIYHSSSLSTKENNDYINYIDKNFKKIKKYIMRYE